MIFHEQPTDPWEDMDFLLLEAYQIMQDELCKCGNPVWLCRSGSSSFRFKVHTVVCQADRAMREYDDNQLPQKEREKDTKIKEGWGAIKFAKPELFDKSLSLPTRAEYMKDYA